jgi:signal transduction histidine kinase
MLQSRSLGWPITLGVVMIVLLVVITIVWVVVTGNIRSWGVLTGGTILLGLVLVGVVFYLQLSIKEIRLNQRQLNFMDSVTHELKSPIASLKLCVQTLSRRQVTQQEEADFHRFMLEDLDRLDRLINQILDAARLDHAPASQPVEDVPLAPLIEKVAESTCLQYRMPRETIRTQIAPALVRGRSIDVEMLFRNLIDNALKFSGEQAQVEVVSSIDGAGRIVTRVVDNGPGIPANLRRKIFGRFVRLGSELERSQSGTGLGLFIVRNLVRRMKGTVTVRSRGSAPGTIFEVTLPGQPAMAADPVA